MPVFLILAVLTALFYYLGYRLHSRMGGPGDHLKCWGLFFAICLVVMLVVLLISYQCSLSTIAWCENFSTRNAEVFVQAVEEYPDAARVKTKADSTEVYQLSYDFVKDTLRYNETLFWYRKYQEHWFFAIFVGRMPDELKYIEAS